MADINVPKLDDQGAALEGSGVPESTTFDTGDSIGADSTVVNRRAAMTLLGLGVVGCAVEGNDPEREYEHNLSDLIGRPELARKAEATGEVLLLWTDIKAPNELIAGRPVTVSLVNKNGQSINMGRELTSNFSLSDDGRYVTLILEGVAYDGLAINDVAYILVQDAQNKNDNPIKVDVGLAGSDPDSIPLAP